LIKKNKKKSNLKHVKQEKPVLDLNRPAFIPCMIADLKLKQ